MWKWEKRGGEGEGVAQGADDVVVVHSKTLLLFSLSLYNVNREQNSKKNVAQWARWKARNGAGVWGVPHFGLARFFMFLPHIFN